MEAMSKMKVLKGIFRILRGKMGLDNLWRKKKGKSKYISLC